MMLDRRGLVNRSQLRAPRAYVDDEATQEANSKEAAKTIERDRALAVLAKQIRNGDLDLSVVEKRLGTGKTAAEQLDQMSQELEEMERDRDLYRAQQNVIQLRVLTMEQENKELKIQLQALKGSGGDAQSARVEIHKKLIDELSKEVTIRKTAGKKDRYAYGILLQPGKWGELIKRVTDIDVSPTAFANKLDDEGKKALQLSTITTESGNSNNDPLEGGSGGDVEPSSPSE